MPGPREWQAKDFESMCHRAGQCHHPPPRRDPDRVQRVNLLDYSFLARSGQESPHNGTCCCVAHHTPHDQLSNIKKAPQFRKLIAAQQLPTTKQKCKHAAGLTCSTSLPDAWMELAWVLPSFLSVFPILRSPRAHGPPSEQLAETHSTPPHWHAKLKNYPWRVCVGVHI